MGRWTLLALSCVGLSCAGCNDATAIDVVGSSYENGVLSVSFVPDADGTPVQPSGSVEVAVLQEGSVVCSFGPNTIREGVYEGPMASAWERIECALEGSGHQIRVTFTPDGGEPLIGTSSFYVPPVEEIVEEVPDPIVAPAPAIVAPAAPTDSQPAVASAPGGTSRRPDWPCSRAVDVLESESDQRFEYDYGGPAECTVPLYFEVMGCPTAAHFRMGTGTFDYDRSFLYADDGRLARVEERVPGSDEIERSFDVYYDAEGTLTRIVDHGRRGNSEMRFTREGSAVVQTGRVRARYELDAQGRLESRVLTNPSGEVMETERRQRRGRRVVGATVSGAGGSETATVTYDYGC